MRYSLPHLSLGITLDLLQVQLSDAVEGGQFRVAA